MPKYAVGFDSPTTLKGVLVELPPVGLVPNGDTVEPVVLTDEAAEFLQTNPYVTVTKLKADKADDVKRAADKAKTADEVQELLVAEDRKEVIEYLTQRKVDLADAVVVEEVEVEPDLAPLTAETQVTPVSEGGEA